MLTTQTLEGIDYVENRNIKKLYNYTLAILREKDEMANDLS